MKKCPRCGKAYPDTETFCEDDGVALASASSSNRGTRVMADNPSGEGAPVECPVCGGKAQPGEVICNFCGTRLAPDQPEEKTAPAPSQASAARTRVSPETYVPASDRPRVTEHHAEQDSIESAEPGDRGFGVLGFVLAAILALAGGAWLAIYLSGRHQAAPVAEASPSPAASPSPVVTLSKTIGVQVNGDLTGATQRDAATLTKVFENNKVSLAAAYGHTLETSPGLSDGMMIRLHVMPDGTVSDASVRVSTAPNPSLDAEVAKAVTGWKFDSSAGSAIDVDYPVILATTSDTASIEADLSKKLASLAPGEAPEYAMAPASPAAAPTPIAAAPPPAPAPAPPPELAPAPPVAPPVVAAPPKPRRHRTSPGGGIASAPPPPSITERLNDELRANRKLRRVQAYAIGGNVTLSGKVFDDNDKMLAERTARGVSGVTSVTNNLTTDTLDWANTAIRINQQLQAAGLPGVTAKVIGKSVYLSGTVKTQLDKDRAVTVAQAAAPVTVRENLIRIEVGKVFGF